MRIVVLDGFTVNPGDNPWDAVAQLGQLEVYDRTSPNQIIARAEKAEIILTNKTPLSEQTLAQLPKLAFISVLATGYNVVDIAAARKRKIIVSNVPGYATNSVVQLTFALLFELCQHVAFHSELVLSGQWSQREDFCFWDTPLIELAGQKMGIIGFGQIGSRVAEVAHALGMEVLAYNSSPKAAPPYQPFAWLSLEEVFTQADVVSLHCPLKRENEQFVNRSLLQRMKRHAILINTARGGLINEVDLAWALDEGLIGAAAVDVVSREPIDPGNPLLKARNCLITPHIGWASLAARQRLMRMTAENIAAFTAGQPINVVN